MVRDIIISVLPERVYSLLFVVLILMLWHRQAIFESKGDELFSSAAFGIRNGPEYYPFRITLWPDGVTEFIVIDKRIFWLILNP